MQFDKNRLLAQPGVVSECPICNTPLIAKCGKVKIWHWAHQNNLECDHWWESVSQWHLDWQALVKPQYREVVVGEHRADIRLSNGQVIELQKSSIPEEQVIERELFYDDMVWVFEGKSFVERFKLYHKTSQAGNEYVKFYWKRPRGYIGVATKPVYIDFGDKVLKIMKHSFDEEYKEYDGNSYTTRAFEGWGYLLTREEAEQQILMNIISED